jgi:3-hydroxy-D-aspartate aldolase
MKTTRRDVLRRGLGVAAVIGVPEMMVANEKRGYSMTELDERIKTGKGLNGLTKADLTTPVLLLDLDLLEANIEKMAASAGASKIALRPHGKTHKCPEIARRQIKAGALGISVATIREAEAMSAAGIKGLLITSELVGRPKIERLIKLMRRSPDTMSVVDNLAHAQQLSDAAVASKVNLNVMLDVDPVGRRTGIQPGDSAVDLGMKVARLPNLKLRGVHGYSGASSHVIGFEARRKHSAEVMTPVIETFKRLKKMGIPMEIMSGGSTGTYNIDPELEGMTELQVGSYVFMDVDYRSIGGEGGAIYEDFAPSLSVMATVVSKNHSDRATTDAGIKAFATDRVKHLPEIRGASGVVAGYAGDEHGVLTFNNPSREFNIGDRVEYIIPHCDPNVNLYDRIFCVRGEKVIDVWRTVGRYGD